MLSLIGTTFVWLSGKWSEALGKRGAWPSTVKTFPATLLPVPILFSISASRWVSVPNCAWPSGRGLATAGTVMSWIIHPSYQPLSLLMTVQEMHCHVCEPRRRADLARDNGER